MVTALADDFWLISAIPILPLGQARRYHGMLVARICWCGALSQANSTVHGSECIATPCSVQSASMLTDQKALRIPAMPKAPRN